MCAALLVVKGGQGLQYSITALSDLTWASFCHNVVHSDPCKWIRTEEVVMLLHCEHQSHHYMSKKGIPGLLILQILA